MAFAARRLWRDVARGRRSILSASDEILLNRFRLALFHRRAEGANSAVPLDALQESLNADAASELSRRGSTLADALQQCPKWFQLHGHAVALTDVGLAVGAVPFSSPPVDADTASWAARRSPKIANAVSKFAALGHPAVHIDVSTPILTADEVDQMSPSLMVANAMVPFRRNSSEPVRHLQRHQRSDGGTSGTENALLPIPELEAFDALYQKKGLVAPSEMLHVLCEYIPTFYVELASLLLTIPPDLRDQVCDGLQKNRDGRYIFVTRPFRVYPMLFQLHQSRFQRSLIRLNMESPYVRSHPDCGRANRAMRKHSQEFSQNRGVVSRDRLRLQYVEKQPGNQIKIPVASNTPDASSERFGAELNSSVPRHLRLKSLPIDAQIMLILLAHLPRQRPQQKPSSKEDAAPFLPLVQWVATFPQVHLDVLNEVPQARVLSIMARHRRIFQLSTVDGSDRNLFFSWSRQDRASEPPGLNPSTSDARCDNDPMPRAEGDPGEEDKGEADSATLEYQRAEDDDPVGTEERVNNFKAAIADDLIGVDELLTSESLQETFDRGEAAIVDENENDDVATAADDGEDAIGKTKDDGPPPRGGEAQYPPQPEGYYVPVGSFDALCVRRLPANVAPGALSDLDFSTTPDVSLLKHVLGFLHPPPSSSEGGTCQWRWVAIEGIYQAIPAVERQRLKQYRGLPNFLRLHGRVFEVSSDTRYVIALDPSGRVPPLIPTQRSFTFEERVVLPPSFDEAVDMEEAGWCFLKDGDDMRTKYRRILGDSQIPMNRAQLKLLDPDNPLLDKATLADEIAGFLPDHPVPLMQLMKRLPPVMMAACPSSQLLRFLQKHGGSKLRVWADEASGKMLVARCDVVVAAGGGNAQPPNTSVWSLARVMKLIEQHAKSVVGCSVRRLSFLLPKEAHVAIQRELGVADIQEAVEMFPERFEVAEGADGRMVVRVR